MVSERDMSGANILTVKTAEDHLGVDGKRPGRRRYRQKEAGRGSMPFPIRVEPRAIALVPLQFIL